MIGRYLAFAGLIISVGTLIARELVAVPTSVAAGQGFGGAVFIYLSFLGVAANFFFAYCYAVAVFPKLRALSFFEQKDVAGFGVPLAILTMAANALVAGSHYSPNGMFLVTDLILNFISPLIYLAWWTNAVSARTLGNRVLFPWLVAFGAYLVLVAVAGAVTGVYPYASLDVHAGGLGQVALYTGLSLILFLVVGIATIEVDRQVGRRPQGA